MRKERQRKAEGARGKERKDWLGEREEERGMGIEGEGTESEGDKRVRRANSPVIVSESGRSGCCQVGNCGVEPRRNAAFLHLKKKFFF